MSEPHPPLAADLRQLLADLARLGVRLSRRGDALACAAPRGALTADARALLAMRKTEILAILGSGAAPPPVSSALRRIPVTPPGAPVPLSPAQRGLWLHGELDDTAAYHMRVALALDGALDTGALDRAIAAVVRRHAALRTSFTTRGGEPVQIVAADADLAISRIDLTARPAPARAAELERLMALAARTPFDRTRAPLVRVGLVRMAPRRHVLLVTLHHLVGDGASLGILAGEIRELYAAELERRAPRLPELAVQYPEFAAWQRQVLDGARLAALRAYWIEALRGAPPVLELPTDRRRTARSDPRGATEPFHVPADLAGELRTLARSRGATLFMALLAGFAAVMARYCDQPDLVIGCPISQRGHDELAPVIGMFVHTLALRIRIAGNPTFEALLDRVRDAARDAYAHQDLPFDQLVHVLRPERSPSHHPVFQIAFVHDTAPAALPGVAGLRFDVLAHAAFDAKFDLALAIREAPDGIRGAWEYRCALFDRATIRRATDHVLEVWRAMVAAPRSRVMQAPLMTAAERRRSRLWNHGGRPRARRRSVLELIDAQVAAAPAAPAVAFADGAWSYAELDDRARRLACHLRGLGAGAGDRVAVLLPRSPVLVAGLLAALRAGAAYVALDPSQPRDRIADQLADAAPAVVITSQALAAGLPASPAAVVRLDQAADAEAIAGATAALPGAARAPDEPAYLMYTSGSTGRPKAAILTHGGLANYLAWSAQAYAITAGTRAAVATSIAVDATITALWSPLVAGGTAVLLPEGDELAALARLLETGGVDLVKLTPSHIDALRAHTGVAIRPGGARAFVIGGEPLRAEHVAWCQAIAPRARVFNEYGPTETVVGCCVHEIAPGEQPPDRVPIGRPIDDTELHVLSPWLEPVPAGVPGELYIGGAGVALGYHRRPRLTAERFVPHPFSIRPGARLYRTGDRAAWSPDGSLRFLGRVDGQVKLRGFRVEPGEIDAHLARHPAVREAVTVLREIAGRPRLVSYVAPIAELTVDAVRDHLAAWLPAHAVPAAIAIVPALPRTPGGKLDRAALPDPVRRSGAAPATDLERELAALWGEVLGRAGVGRDDDFFELGGDSIIALQLAARARERGLRLAPRLVFEHPTPARLAAVARRDEVAAPRGPVTGPVALGPMQRGFFAQDLVEPHHFNQSIALDVPAAIDGGALRRALGHLMAHHDALRTRFRGAGGEVTAEIAPPEPVELAVADLAGRPAAEQQARMQALIAEDQASLRLDGALVLPRLVRLGAARPARLVLTAHHLVVDAVSWRILVEDLLRAYRAEATGAAPALPPRTTAYRDWVARLAAWADSPELTAEQAYWTRVPDAPRAELALDEPYRAEANRAGYAVEQIRALSADDTRALRGSAAARGASIQDLLLAALVRALAGSGACGTVTVDVEGHGRDETPGPLAGIDLSRSVGWFTSVFPVHLPLAAGRDAAGALAAVTERLRAVPHAGLGSGALRYLSADPAVRAAMAAVPAAQIRFNYLGQLDAGQPAATGFALAAEPCAPQRSPFGQRRHLLDLDAWIHDGQLTTAWTSSRRLFAPRTVAALADRLVAALGELARTCATAAHRHAPSDFADVALSRARTSAEGSIGAVGRRLREPGDGDEPPAWSPLVAIRTTARGAPLCCVPGAAIDAISLHPLARALGDDHPFHAIQPRGLDGRLAPHASIEAMAADVVAAVRAVQPRGPYHLAGHSSGAHVAFEASQQLRDAGCDVALVALIDAEARPPRRGPAAPPRSDADRLVRLRSLVRRFVGRELSPAFDAGDADDTAADRSSDPLVERVARELAETGVLPAGLDAERIRAYLAVGEATALALDAYRPTCRHPIDAILFRAAHTHRDDAALGAGDPTDDSLGWRSLTGRPVPVCWVPGDHVTMMTRPHVEAIAATLRAALRRHPADRTAHGAQHPAPSSSSPAPSEFAPE